MGEIRKSLVYGNFKPSRGERRKKREKLKQRPGMSDAHLAAVRKLPCCKCKRGGPSEAHHLKQGTGERGAGMRSSDRWAVPLCPDCHGEVERIGSRNEISWFDAFEVDSLALANGLWTVSDDHDAMFRVLAAHIQL